jgi:8-oxo-dGTP pyrophosphatase MutT (NUDIX family)
MEQRYILSTGPAGLVRLSKDDIREELARGLDPTKGRGDHALEALIHGGAIPPGATIDPDRPLTPAAVLVPLVERPDGLTVMLTKRTAHLAHHPGQISFPGGRLEPDDQGDRVACALRETEEEVGLSVDLVQVLGRLDDYTTGTGFLVTPVVGMVRPPFDLSPDTFEVEEVFEVPLGFLLDTSNHSLQSREYKGRQRPFWSMTWDGKVIWGATAGILVNLSEVLGGRGR